MQHMSSPAAQPDTATLARTAPAADEIGSFPDRINAIAARHRPSRSAFFRHLAALPETVARDPAVLGRIYLVYQAAMHATRASVYFLPHLDSPALRKRKLQIYIDDDGLPGGDTHHYQLARAFRGLGAELPLSDDAFGDLDELCARLDAETAAFVRLAKVLYARSLGAWCVVEIMSNEWMHALAAALAVHHPHVVNEPYFAECFAQGIEERHAAESLDVTRMVLRQRPRLVAQTLRDAEIMAAALDKVWDRLDRIVTAAG
jgi:hypothetical protein